VFRNDYLLALRKLSRQHKPDAYIRAMLKVWQFSATLYGEDADAMELALRQANAFADPEENVLNWGNVIA